jgi:hypothetical protein
MTMKTSKQPQKRQQRNNNMAKTQQQKKKIKGIESKDGGDRDEYSRQQREHRESDMNINQDYNSTAAARKSLNDLGENQADDDGMMPSIQSKQHGTPEEEFTLPMKNTRADPFGRIPVPHDNDV